MSCDNDNDDHLDADVEEGDDDDGGDRLKDFDIGARKLWSGVG